MLNCRFRLLFFNDAYIPVKHVTANNFNQMKLRISCSNCITRFFVGQNNSSPGFQMSDKTSFCSWDEIANDFVYSNFSKAVKQAEQDFSWNKKNTQRNPFMSRKDFYSILFFLFLNHYLWKIQTFLYNNPFYFWFLAKTKVFLAITLGELYYMYAWCHGGCIGGDPYSNVKGGEYVRAARVR